MTDDMGALRAENEALRARVDALEAQADPARRTWTVGEIAAMEGRLTSLRRQADESRVLAGQAAANFALFAEQQSAGQRSVPETAGVLDTMIRAERAAVDMQYDIARMQVRIAARLGQLVDGERM